MIAWIGPDADAAGLIPLSGPDVVDLDGALVLPGFVDAHVHVTETGLLLTGVDLSATRSVTEILDLVAGQALRRPGRPVLGHGWDELNLTERRPPTAAELDRAAPGAPVYLSRVDVHSAVVSGTLAAGGDLRALVGWDDSGRVERDAHHAARHATRFSLEPADRRSLQLTALHSAAAAGLVELHEMSAPHVAPDADLTDLLALAADAHPSGRLPVPHVVAYRGELAGDEQSARQIAARFAVNGAAGSAGSGNGAAGSGRSDGRAGVGGRAGVAGLAGDLMVDGSFGSRTARLNADYNDAPGQRGHLYLDAEQIRDHVVGCTRAGLQAGFHVIGEGAVDAVLAGFEAAALIVGEPAIRAARHRLEHLEAIGPAGVETSARLGLLASVQPAFDAAWGGPERMYAVRLGRQRAAGLNPFAAMLTAGLQLAFGSDSPVTPFAPWEAIRAALLHRTPQQRIGIEAALHACTTAARAAAAPGTRAATAAGIRAAAGSGITAVGGLDIGAAADFACWRSPAIDDAVRRRVPLLRALATELAEGDRAPVCERTVIGGHTAFAVG